MENGLGTRYMVYHNEFEEANYNKFSFEDTKTREMEIRFLIGDDILFFKYQKESCEVFKIENHFHYVSYEDMKMFNVKVTDPGDIYNEDGELIRNTGIYDITGTNETLFYFDSFIIAKVSLMNNESAEDVASRLKNKILERVHNLDI